MKRSRSSDFTKQNPVPILLGSGVLLWGNFKLLEFVGRKFMRFHTVLITKANQISEVVNRRIFVMRFGESPRSCCLGFVQPISIGFT